MKCPNCGEELKSGAKFCTSCGTNIEAALEERAKAELAAKKEQEQKEQKEIEEKRKTAVEENKKEVVNETPEVKPEEPKFKKVEPKKKPEPKKTSSSGKKKKHTGIKVFFFLLIVLILLAIIFYGLYKLEVFPEEVNDAVSPVISPIEELFNKEIEKLSNEFISNIIKRKDAYTKDYFQFFTDFENFKEKANSLTPDFPNKFDIIDVEPDGNCFMRCIALFIYNNENEHLRCRNEISNYLLSK